MKIGIVCPYDVVRGGGVQEHVLAQATELKKRGHMVKILTPKPRKQAITAPNGIDVILIGTSAMVRTPLKTSLELGGSWTPDQVDEVLEREKFDLIHIHEPEVPFLGSQIVAKATCPIVATFHAIHPETPMGRTIETFRVPYSRSIFTKLTELTAVSEPAATFVRNRTEREVHIIPNGIDLKKYQFKPQSTLPKMKSILYVGRLEKRKGIIYLVKAYEQLCEQRDDVELQIAGTGPLHYSLEEYIKSRKIPRVSFLGFISEADKLALLHKASLFCSPALYGESFGIVLLEAMASGTVTIAGNNPGYTSVMQGTGRQSLVNPKQTDEFTRRLDIMLDDQAIRTAWLDWAKEYVQQFSYDQIVDKYEVVYKQALKAKRT